MDLFIFIKLYVTISVRTYPTGNENEGAENAKEESESGNVVTSPKASEGKEEKLSFGNSETDNGYEEERKREREREREREKQLEKLKIDRTSKCIKCIV